MGLKRGAAAARAWRDSSLLQVFVAEHPGRDSLAKPGVGVGQTLKDEGRSTIGSVTGVEPYMKVLKDGFFQVGCYHDSMLEFGDMYGNGKFKYDQDSTNVSVAMYSELVLEEQQEAMKPTVCFEFCRTVPGMVYFGISNGRTCYCTPFYKPQAGDNQQCDAPCEGDSTMMCGNMKGKSSIWEMHLCDDTATDLGNALSSSKEVLDFYFENAALAKLLGEKMNEAGALLAETASLSGGPQAAGNGRSAVEFAKTLTQAFQLGSDVYPLLLDAYNAGKAVKGGDFGVPKTVTAAEHATADIKLTRGRVLGAAGEIHSRVLAAYPAADFKVFGDEPDSADSVATSLAKKVAPTDFRIVPYAFGDTQYEPVASSCSGERIGSPLVALGENGCAVACENTLYPLKCVAYTFYTVDGVSDLCFLLSEVRDAETFECKEEAFLQNQQSAQGSKADIKKAAAVCKVKMSEISTGYRPKGEWKKLPRCFGSDKSFTLQADMSELSMPEGNEVKLGSGKPLLKAE